MTATGDAGTVYLCHPFLVHAAQPHHGERPRVLAQPPLLPADPENRPRGDLNPVELATAARSRDRFPRERHSNVQEVRIWLTTL